MEEIGYEYYDEPYGSTLKRKARSRHMDFVGWGSKQLIEFLQKLGVDTSKQIARYDVVDIVNRYASEKNLSHPDKKKRIVCDELLYSLFGKKQLVRMKTYEMLEAHYAENQGGMDSDSSCGSDGENGGQHKILDEKKVSGLKFKIPEKPKSCFASIVPENLRLLYLKKSLVQDLLKDSENFEAKVVGCFVRIKSDPYDYSQKNPYMLVLVKGLKKASGTDVLLQVSNYIKDVGVPMLSDDDFKQEECEDLKQRVKNGQLKRPTVVEFQEKARILHQDITEHWLPREIALLQRFIDRANEKGWRRELAEYLDKKQLLQTPAEQERLLREVPEVVADELEPEAVPQDLLNDTNGNDGSPEATSAPEIPSFNTAENRVLSAKVPVATSAQEIPSFNTPENRVLSAKVPPRANSFVISFDGGKDGEDGQKLKPVSDLYINAGKPWLSNRLEKKVYVENQKASKPEKKPDTQIIELSDDEDEQVDSSEVPALDIQAIIWHYLDPSGVAQGPFPLSFLKHWKDDDYFPDDFVVWKTGQSPKDAVLLTSLLGRWFPR